MKLQQSQENRPTQSFLEPDEGEKEVSTLKFTQTDSRFLVRANTQFEDEVRASRFSHTQGGAELPLSNNPFASCHLAKGFSTGGAGPSQEMGGEDSDEGSEDFDRSLMADLDAASFLGELQVKSDVSSFSQDQSPFSPKDSSKKGSPSQREPSLEMNGSDEEIEGIVEMSGVALLDEMDCEDEIPKRISNVPLESETNSDAWSSFEEQDSYLSFSHERKRRSKDLLSQFKEEVAELTQQITQVQHEAKQRDFLSQQGGPTQGITQREFIGVPLNKGGEGEGDQGEGPSNPVEGLWGGKGGKEVRSLCCSVFRNRDEESSEMDEGEKMKKSSLSLSNPTNPLSSLDSSGPLADPLRHLVGKIPGHGGGAVLSLSETIFAGPCADECQGDGEGGGFEGGTREGLIGDEAGREVSVANFGSDGSGVEGGESKISDETVLVDIPQSDGHFDRGAALLFFFLSLLFFYSYLAFLEQVAKRLTIFGGAVIGFCVHPARLGGIIGKTKSPWKIDGTPLRK